MGSGADCSDRSGICAGVGIRTNVVGQAMEQTLENDDNILVNRFAYIMSKPKAGDVIVFLPNGNNKSHYYVRRVVAVPGDTVQIKDGALYVNDAGLASDPIELEKDEYFVLGDNRNNSEDSRYANIGNVKRDYIIGKAWFRFSGLGSFGTIK